MNPKQYVKNVLVTEARDMAPLQERFTQIRNIRLLHGAMGLSSELAEIQEMAEKPSIDAVNLKEEMGDLFWYMGIVVDELQLDSEKVFTHNDTGGIVAFSTNEQRTALQFNVNKLVIAVGILTDLLKKSIMYGKELNIPGIEERLQHIDYHINQSLRYYGQTSAGARDRNIEKLKKRYGQKFTEAAALERDLAAERAILEKKD